jgi:hypothetical protein
LYEKCAIFVKKMLGGIFAHGTADFKNSRRIAIEKNRRYGIRYELKSGLIAKRPLPVAAAIWVRVSRAGQRRYRTVDGVL